MSSSDKNGSPWSGRHKWIVLSGSHSVGKTTLMDAVKRVRPEVETMTEVARILLRERNWVRDDILPENYPENFHTLNREILVRQKEEFGKLDPGKWSIIDRGLDALGYIRLHLGEKPFLDAINSTSAQHLIRVFKQHCHVVLIEPHRCLVEADNIRITPTFQEMVSLHKTILDLYESLEIPFTLIRDLDLQTRIGLIEEMMEQTH